MTAHFDTIQFYRGGLLPARGRAQGPPLQSVKYNAY